MTDLIDSSNLKNDLHSYKMYLKIFYKGSTNMLKLLPISFRFVGWAAAGVALGAGLKLGSYLVDAAMGEKEIAWPNLPDWFKGNAGGDPLWKKEFGKISDD